MFESLFDGSAAKLQTLAILEKVEWFAKQNGGDRSRAVHQTTVYFMVCDVLDNLGVAFALLHGDNIRLHCYAVRNIEKRLDQVISFAEENLGLEVCFDCKARAPDGFSGRCVPCTLKHQAGCSHTNWDVSLDGCLNCGVGKDGH